MVVVEGLFRYHMRMILIGISREIEFELRDDLFRQLTLLAPRFYQTHRIGDLMSRATNDLSAVRMVLGPGIMYTANTAATFVATIVLMLRISPLLLGLALVPLFFVSFLARVIGRRIHDRFESVQAQLSELNAIVQENLSGARVVRAYAQEPQEMARFEAANQEYVRRNRALIRLFGSLYPGIQLLMGLGAVMVLWLGGTMVVRGTITLGEFVAFGAYLAMLHWPMIALGWVVNIFERGEASMGRIDEILGRARRDRRRGPLRPAPAIRGDVEFRDLTFAYDGRPVLHDVTLAVPAGTTVAIVGPTGSGKSTLVSLIPRLFEAPAGTVLVDGHDVRTIPLHDLRGAVGFVPQETFLFSDTVGENVAFGLQAGDPEALRRAHGGRGRGGPAGQGRPGLPPGLRDVRGRARHHALRRTEAARGAGPGPGHRPAHPGPRRRPGLGGHLHRGGDPGRPQGRDGGAHHLPRLAPRLHGEGGRPHRGAPRGAHRGAGHPRRAGGPRAASTPTSIAASSWRRRWRGRRERGSARGVSAASFHEDDAVAKSYDRTLLLRLLTYLRPYKAAVAASFLLIVVMAGLDLVGPYLTKVAIDRHITAGRRRRPRGRWPPSTSPPSSPPSWSASARS